MGAGGRAGRWAQAHVVGVRTGAQGVLALGVGASARAIGAVAALRHAGGRGAQALGRTGERHGMGARSAGGSAGARQGKRAHGRRRQLARQAQAWACGARGLGVPVHVGWACWLVSWASFGAQCTWLSFDSVFDRFDSVFFLSH